MHWLNQLKLYRSLVVFLQQLNPVTSTVIAPSNSDWFSNLIKNNLFWGSPVIFDCICSFPSSNRILLTDKFWAFPPHFTTFQTPFELSSYFLWIFAQLSSRHTKSRLLTQKLAWQWGARGLSLWLQRSLQMIAYKTTPAHILESEWPLAIMAAHKFFNLMWGMTNTLLGQAPIQYFGLKCNSISIDSIWTFSCLNCDYRFSSKGHERCIFKKCWLTWYF